MGEENKTSFTLVYNRFLDFITDDMYMELTPADTRKDLQRLLVNAIPGFEFPRKNLYDYTIEVLQIKEDQVEEEDVIIGVIWDELSDGEEEIPDVLIERSRFNIELTAEEINILALLMVEGWLQRQIASVENTRMKFSSQTFKFTSQANHLSKLLNLLSECQRQSFHMQRLYKRRKTSDGGNYVPNWSVLTESRIQPKGMRWG